MRRIVVVATAVGAALLGAVPAVTAGAPRPQIRDPYGDANAINDQSSGDGSFGDVTGLPQALDAADLRSVRFESDATHLYIDVRTTQAPPATYGIGLRVAVNGEPGDQCLGFEAFYPGVNNSRTEPEAFLLDYCSADGVNAPEFVPVEIQGTRFVVPRSAHPALRRGEVLTKPQAQSFLFSTVSPVVAVWAPDVDTTKVGKDYELDK